MGMGAESVMRRIVVVGCPGSGKSTMARELARRFDLTHIELDALFHQPGWTPTPSEEFQAKIRVAMDEADTATNGWASCGQYGNQSGWVHLDRADTVVWLDLSRFVVMRRLVRRTIKRAVTREELWNGNREPLTNFYKWDPEQNVIRWAWVKFDGYRTKYEAAQVDGSWAHVKSHRLRSRAEVDEFLNQIGEP